VRRLLQVGTLLFGKAIAHNFDIHSKTWYYLATVLLSSAIGEGLHWALLLSCCSAVPSMRGRIGRRCCYYRAAQQCQR
jgi:hypothetical protein